MARIINLSTEVRSRSKKLGDSCWGHLVALELWRSGKINASLMLWWKGALGGRPRAWLGHADRGCQTFPDRGTRKTVPNRTSFSSVESASDPRKTRNNSTLRRVYLSINGQTSENKWGPLRMWEENTIFWSAGKSLRKMVKYTISRGRHGAGQT